jgi:hypothetical protein
VLHAVYMSLLPTSEGHGRVKKGGRKLGMSVRERLEGRRREEVGGRRIMEAGEAGGDGRDGRTVLARYD